MGRNVSRSGEKVALRYVRGEDLGFYGSGGRGSSDAGNTGSHAWAQASGTGQSSGHRWKQAREPFCVDTARGRGPWVSLRISLLKGPYTERRGV